MSLTITDDQITSPETPETAAPSTMRISSGYRATAPEDGSGAWTVSWLPDRLFDRNEAITAMTLAETLASGAAPGDAIWPFVEDWAEQLQITATDARQQLERRAAARRDRDPAALRQAQRFILAHLRQDQALVAAPFPVAADGASPHALTILAQVGPPPPRRAPITQFALVSADRDRRALWHANGYGDEQPVARVDLVCRCGWSYVLDTPPGTHCVTAIGADTPARTLLLTDVGFDDQCHQLWDLHAQVATSAPPDHDVDAAREVHALRAVLPHVPGAPLPKPAALADDAHVGRKYDAASEHWTRPQPVSFLKLTCSCGWRSELLDVPAGTRVTYPVTRADAFEPIVLTSADFLAACVERFHVHLSHAVPTESDAAAVLDDLSAPRSPRGTDREPTLAQHAALQRLLAVATGDTGQSRRVANFLLAWWNAEECGAFDLTDVWSLDVPLRADVATVFVLILTHQRYPDSLGYAREFEGVIAAWRPELAARARADRTPPSPPDGDRNGSAS